MFVSNQENDSSRIMDAPMTNYDDCTSSSSRIKHGTWLREDCIDFMKENLYNKVHRVKDRVGLLRLAIDKAYFGDARVRYPNAQFLEFGVHEGKDIVRMASFLQSLESSKHKKKPATAGTIFHGFDSFEGLPEDWNNGKYLDVQQQTPMYAKGTFDVGGRIPENLGELVQLGNKRHKFHNNMHNNIQFHKGWFEDTLPIFFQEISNANQPCAFIHADADLYSSTICFLQHVCQRKLLVRGSVIVFDEFWNYPNWQNDGEFKAFQEMATEYDLKYKYLAYHGPPPDATPDTPNKNKQHKKYGYQSIAILILRDMK